MNLRSKISALIALAGMISLASFAEAQPPAQSSQPASTSGTQVQGARGGRGGRGGGNFRPVPRPGDTHAGFNPALPTVWVVGDSTAKNSRDDGTDGGRWGWAHELAPYFDTAKINVENSALGGTSSRDFRTKGSWARVLEKIKPGDYILIQFGANDGGGQIDDSRARKSLSGNGEDSQTVSIQTRGERTSETVHTYGWYLRQDIEDARAKGATPVVLSLIPRDDWPEGKLPPAEKSNYVQWAGEAAKQDNAFYINHYKIITDMLNPMGESVVKGTFYRSDDHTHTLLIGAQANALCVVQGIRALPELKLNDYLASWAKDDAVVKPTSPENVMTGEMNDAAPATATAPAQP